MRTRLRAIVWDLFGTLVPIATRRGYRAMCRQILRVLRAPEDRFMAVWEADREARMTGALSVEENFHKIVGRDLGLRRPSSAYDDALAIYHRYHVRWMRPKPDAVPTLRALAARGYAMALLSNCSSAVSTIWPTTPLAPWFQVAVLSCEVGLAKPDPKAFAFVCRRLSLSPQQCLYVGDGGDGELTAAERTGMVPMRVAHHTHDGLIFSRDGLSLRGMTSLRSLLRVPILLR